MKMYGFVLNRASAKLLYVSSVLLVGGHKRPAGREAHESVYPVSAVVVLELVELYKELPEVDALPSKMDDYHSLIMASSETNTPRPVESADAEDLNKKAVFTAMGMLLGCFEGSELPHLIPIPDALYLDRYQEDNKKESVEPQGESRTANHTLQKTATLQDKLVTVASKG